MAAASKEEYLKRYLSNSDAGAKKKRKKKLKTGVKLGKSLIIDDDVNLSDIKVKHDTESRENLLELAEENPLIFDEAGSTVLSKDLETIKRKEEARKAMWAPVRNVTEDELDERRGISSEVGETDHATKRNERTKSTLHSGFSPHRRQRHDSPSPERTRTNRNCASSDLSPPRQGRNNSPEILREKLSPGNSDRGAPDDQSPPRRRARHDSPDTSPPRNSRHDSSSDQSPPRRNKDGSPLGHRTLSRKRKVTYARSSFHKQKRDSEHRRHSSHRARDDSLSDQSPRRRQNNLDDERLPRKRNRCDTPDLSPSRKKIVREGSSDQSPPRRNYTGHSQSSRERTRRSTPDQSPPRQKRSKDHGPLDAKKNERKAGLHSAAELRRENELARIREDEMFSRLSSSATGKGVETVHRDKEGRKRDLKGEKAKKKEEEKKKLEEDEKFMEWGKGLKQTKDAKEKVRGDVYEMNKPLARYKDDKDLEQMLKDRERAEDPMLAFLQKKRAKQDAISGKKEKPKYKGPAPAPNRFNIQPGYRWDGVDRSNGFEKKRFAMLANKGATREEAYKWSTEDM